MTTLLGILIPVIGIPLIILFIVWFWKWERGYKIIAVIIIVVLGVFLVLSVGDEKNNLNINEKQLLSSRHLSGIIKTPIPAEMIPIINQLKEFSYEFGWAGGAANNNKDGISYFPVTAVKVKSNKLIVFYSWADGKLIGVVKNKIYKGRWRQNNGKGDFLLKFNNDFSLAKGWWNDGENSPRHFAAMKKT